MHGRRRSRCKECRCNHNIPRGSRSECDKSEAERLSRRKRAQKAKTRENGIAPPEKPLVRALYDNSEEVTVFLRKHEDLLPLLQNPKLISVIDTGASKHRRNRHKNANRSRKGTDSQKFAVFSVQKEELFYLWLKHGNENCEDLLAHVRKWKKEDYGKKKNVDGSFVTTMDEEMDEEAQRLFVDFVEGTKVLEYGSNYTSVDAMCIKSWLKIYGENARLADKVKFFNLGLGVCFTTWNSSSKGLFGPRGIVRTPGA